MISQDAVTATGNDARQQPWERVEVRVHVHAHIVSAAFARRKVNGWLLWELGERVSAGEPELLIGEVLYWRVPIRWIPPGQATALPTLEWLLVDAATGTVLADESTSGEIRSHVTRVATAIHLAAG